MKRKIKIDKMRAERRAQRDSDSPRNAYLYSPLAQNVDAPDDGASF